MARYRQLLDTILAAYILALAGCGGGSGAVALPPTPAALYGVTASNLEIATALYQDSARTPAGSRLACIENGRACAGHRFDKSRRARGNPGEALNKIQCDALGREQSTRRAFDCNQFRTPFNRRTILHDTVDPRCR